MGWFFNKDKDGAQAAAQAESERLLALPLPDLAAAILPAFGPDGMQISSGHQRGAIEVSNWLMSATSTSVKWRQPLLAPIIEALQALENASLMTHAAFGPRGSGSTYRLTRAGEEALANGTTAQLLATH